MEKKNLSERFFDATVDVRFVVRGVLSRGLLKVRVSRSYCGYPSFRLGAGVIVGDFVDRDGTLWVRSMAVRAIKSE